MTDIIDINIYKQAKALTGDKENERIEILCSYVSQLIKTYCGNSFVDYATSPKVEYFSIKDSQKRIQLEEWPVIEVSEVAERTDPTLSYTVLTDNTDYVVDEDTEIIERIDQSFPKGVKSLKVTYTAGYTTLPTDLLLAAIDLVSFYLHEEHKTQKQLFGASITNAGTSTIRGNIGFPDHIKRVLDLYREIF